jgi:GNAT superfamily N-acetyltransferase
MGRPYEKTRNSTLKTAPVNQSFSSPVVVCRPALPCDKADMLEFTKFTWDFGRDYIKSVWDVWLADPQGFLATAEYAGHCVGFAKATLSAPGQWWLEGFRVDPKFQGLHIGSHIHDYLDGWWLEHGNGVARLMSSSVRPKVHHLAEKLGYVKTLVMKELQAPILDEPCANFQPVKTDEISTALQTALASPVLASANGIFDLGWEVIHPTQEILTEIQQQGLAFWWRERDGLLLTWDQDSADGKVLGIGLPACVMDSLPEMLLDIRRLAAQRNCAGVFWVAPLRDEILSAAETAGCIHHREHDNYLYEKCHTRP